MIHDCTPHKTKEPPTMGTNRIKRIEAKWLAFLLTKELATTQDIVAARARQAAMVAERLRRRRRGG